LVLFSKKEQFFFFEKKQKTFVCFPVFILLMELL